MDQLSLAEKLYNQNPELAISIALGDEDPPEGILASAVYAKVCDVAEKSNNLDLSMRIANSFHNSKLSADAQKFKFRDSYSAIEKMKEVVNVRREAFEKTLPKSKTTEDAVKEEVAKIQKEIAKTPKEGLTKDEWLELLDNVTEK